jgi:hypothetical protein
MDAAQSPRDRSTPWIVGAFMGVVLSYLAMFAAIAIAGWAGVSEDGFEWLDWTVLALGCGVAALASRTMAVRLGAPPKTAGWIGVFSAAVVLATVVLVALMFALFIDWALEDF